MPRKYIWLLVVFILILTSCGPGKLFGPIITPLPTSTSIFTQTYNPTITASPTITPSEQPHLNLQEEAVLYSGPGNIDFDSIAILPEGSKIYPQGVYVDFVKVLTVVNGTDITGYVLKKTLGSLPSTVPILQSDQVPWKPLYSPDCSPGVYDSITKTTKLASSGDIASNPIHLDAPLRIRIDSLFLTNGNTGTIIIYGWREQTRLDIAAEGGKYSLWFRDSWTQPVKYEISDLGISDLKPIQIIFDQINGNSFSVQDGNGVEIRHVDLESLGLNMPKGLFPDGNFHIGTSMPPNSTMVIVGLSAGIIPDGKAFAQQDMEPGLAQLAGKYNLTIGAALSIGSMMEGKYCNIAQRNFDVVALGDFSYNVWWLGPGEYDWSILDQEVNYFSLHGYRIEASHLIWGPAVPDWLRKTNFTRDEYINILKQYIKDVVGRYKGRVQEWSIANEVISRYIGGDTQDFWREKIGLDYIEIAFRTAREADPNGVLVFNDSENDSIRDTRSSQVIDKMYATVRDLKAKGVPIDVVGMQMHMLVPWESQTPPKVEDMVKTMQAFAKLGVRIYITEFDVTLHNRPGTQPERWQFEAKIYQDAITACIESAVCNRFTVWGISDIESWLTCDEVWCTNTWLDAEPLMFDSRLNPKPAYFAVRDVLLNYPLLNPP